ncbi:MAG: hypothetical protein PHX80_04730 [Candidatus Nanoarchaeia archaeon]|nr:hypothetical protein [Candidatus Nanoarchaeia archaeon]
MAVYNWSVIETNLVGNTDVTIVENNINNGMQMLLNSIATRKFRIKTVKIWTTNEYQLDEPIGFTKKDAHGNRSTDWITPVRDLYALQNQYDLKAKNVELTEETEVEYNILPSTVVEMKFKMDDVDTSASIGNLKILEDYVGKGVVYDKAIKDFDTDTLDQTPSEWNIKLQEPEESQENQPNPTLNFDGVKEISENTLKKYAIKPVQYKLPNAYIILALAITTGVIVIKFGLPSEIIKMIKK